MLCVTYHIPRLQIWPYWLYKDVCRTHINMHCRQNYLASIIFCIKIVLGHQQCSWSIQNIQPHYLSIHASEELSFSFLRKISVHTYASNDVQNYYATHCKTNYPSCVSILSMLVQINEKLFRLDWKILID